MLKTTYLLLLLVVSTHSFAQFHTTYNWVETPKLHPLSAEDANVSSVGILKKHIVEYVYNTETPDPIRYETEHTIVRVNDDKGIARHNTVYIPMYEVNNVVKIKARTINAQGKVTILNQDNIKEVKNVEDYGDFKIFAIEGVEKGSEIEVLYTVEKTYDMYGSEILQSDYKINEVEFVFITGILISNAKAYFTNTHFTDTVVNDKRAKVLRLNNMPPMIKEEYATPDANRISVVYQCYPPGQNITQDMFWNNVSNNISSQMFPNEINPLALADIDSITKHQETASVFKKVALLDNFVKNNFNIVKNNNEELSDLNYILKHKSASKYGILKLYATYLTALGIDFEIVVTANRHEYKFDPTFFTPNMLREFMIYLPSEKKYIAPDRVDYRVGEAPPNYLGNYGLFIKKDGHYLAKIHQADPNYSQTNRVIDISFDEDFMTTTLDVNQEYTGHWAATYRAILSLSPEQTIKQLKSFLTASGVEDKETLLFETQNNNINQTEYNQPFIAHSKVSSESLIEDAGNSYLFQVGMVIGTQSELYQETERMNPIEMSYPNEYNYTITVEIPKGYTVEGLKSLNINENYKDTEGNTICKFESGYTLENDKLIIKIQEFYRSNEYDKDRYEEFRSVINAASDFNKAAILFIPE